MNHEKILKGVITVAWFGVLAVGIRQIYYILTYPDPWYVQLISKASHYWIWW